MHTIIVRTSNSKANKNQLLRCIAFEPEFRNYTKRLLRDIKLLLGNQCVSLTFKLLNIFRNTLTQHALLL